MKLSQVTETGDRKISEECVNCYIGDIIRKQKRAAFEGPYKSVSTWNQPDKWHKTAPQKRRERVFTCSLSDFFHEQADPWRRDAWDIIRRCWKFDWLILTKRTENVADRLPPDWGDGWPHVWLGATCGEESSYERLDALGEIPAVLRFISAEPLLSNLDLRPWLDRYRWVVAGAESGPKRRPMNMLHLDSLAGQCTGSNPPTPLFVKQGGHFKPGKRGLIPDRLWQYKEFPKTPPVQPPKKAGDLF